LAHASVSDRKHSGHHDHHGDHHHHHHHGHGHHFGDFFHFGFPRSFFFESVSTVEFFGAGFGGPFGFGGFVPFYSWPGPVFYDAPVAGPFASPAELQPRIEPVLPRGVTTDIPERLVEQLIAPPRRPTLAQRAEAARLEGAGDRVFRAGLFGRAAERYGQALEKAPDSDETRFKLGAALVASGQYHRASQTLREALRQRPDWPHVAHDLRGLFPDEAAILRTLDALERELQRPNANPHAAFLRGYILYFSGEREAAEAIFRDLSRDQATEHVRAFLDAIERMRQP
jgi:Flp pilus assembly protein TadD